MYCHISAGGLRGLESYVAQVEVDVSNGLPCFDMVGLLASEVKEARERIRVALKNAGVKMPVGKITVNLSPAGIHKAGTAYDLPVALCIMAAQGMIPAKKLEGILAVGELGLDASVKPVRGILPMVQQGFLNGIGECILPLSNLKEGMLVEGALVMGVKDLGEAARYLCCEEPEREILRKKAKRSVRALPGSETETDGEQTMDFGVIQGMQDEKFAALTAAAGLHNLLYVGPPGAGKTMLARCLPSILPPLGQAEKREISAIYSVAGRLSQGSLLEKRPFVAPHHTVSDHALAGGGAIPMPGLVSLAHKGVLFLDEMAEFKRGTLDILRQPLEDRVIFLAKSGGNFLYRADFMLMAAANPCPCGFYPDRARCRCTSLEIRRYHARISGPLLDRIDLFCRVEPMPFDRLWGAKDAKSSASETESGWDSRLMQEKVMLARERQARRYAQTRIVANGRLGPGEIARYCSLGLSEQQFMEQATQQLRCSARACHHALRVARTLADLEGQEKIRVRHLSQALHYRKGESYTGIRKRKRSISPGKNAGVVLAVQHPGDRRGERTKAPGGGRRRGRGEKPGATDHGRDGGEKTGRRSGARKGGKMSSKGI